MIGPGLMLTGMFLLYVILRLRLRPDLAPVVADDIVEKAWPLWMALLKMVPALFVFFLVMGLVMLRIPRGLGRCARRYSPPRQERNAPC